MIIDLKCGYTKRQLILATASLPDEETPEAKDLAKKIDDIGKTFPELSDKKLLNEGIANSNGITVSELLNGPNYEVLRDEYVLSRIYLFKDEIVKAGITDVQAWGIICYGLNLLT